MEFNTISYQSQLPIAICADHAGFPLKTFLIEQLQKQGIQYKDFGTFTAESMDYADVAHPLAQAIESGQSLIGIAICGSGNGINMTINKHQALRSALCWKKEIALLARQHNDANVIALPARFISPEEAFEMVKVFLETPFEGGRHSARVQKISCSC